MAGTVLGEVQGSLFVAGAVLGEICQYKMLAVSPKSNLVGVWTDGFGLCRVMVGSWSDRPRIVNDGFAVFSRFLSDFGWSFCVAGAVFGEVGG